ncbi:DUF1697 domain-containing protein [Sinomonas sp. R1AF57]|uniref:DUF1697 domain-containing protein n=1 Tax=Sinomonas sp. R1AF57 TaxID=2020377 RepID=UPI000B619EE4|nr:DUF1697 domain-containing protein [Sinomonas sp. R1AF57]ASN52214.1 pyridoxamine 5-phosphate oxidase [Sinomonas sp. R1AF57]
MSVRSEYAVFLRGVNVGGITVKMAALREALSALPVEGVTTLLASGNVVLATRLGVKELKSRVEQALRDAFGYDAWVIVLDRDDVRSLIDACPYPADDASTHSYITLSSDPAALDELWDATAGDGTDERARLSPVATAWRCPKGSTLDSPMSKATAKPKFKATTTTRNLRTLLKVQAAFPPEPAA